MNKLHLFEPLIEKQNSKCVLMISDECSERDGWLPDRYWISIDRIISGKDGGTYELDNCQLICKECDWEKEGNRPSSPNPVVLTIYKQYKLWQLEAGRMERKLKSYTGSLSGTTASPYFDDYTKAELEEEYERFVEREEVQKKRLVKAVRNTKEWRGFMSTCPGLGEITAALLIGKVDIALADTVSSLWRYLGYVPTKGDDKVDDYNPGKGKAFKSALYAALSISLIRKDSPYRPIYDTYRSRDLGHGQALYRVIKLWLSHLWSTWRSWAGLLVTEPYANNHLGHDGYYDPKNFNWPDPIPQMEMELD